jgi:hypothetical protein
MSNIKLFESTQIRSVWLEDEQKWFFSVVDVVAALTDSAKPRDYWYRIKQREKISDIELPTICRQLKLPSPDGKEREQTAPTPKACCASSSPSRRPRLSHLNAGWPK